MCALNAPMAASTSSDDADLRPTIAVIAVDATAAAVGAVQQLMTKHLLLSVDPNSCDSALD